MSAAVTSRPRVEGDRECEILEAVVGVLIEVGYDKLTFDAAAAAARASKATLYRRWSSKADLVVDAVVQLFSGINQPDPDTGSLRGDLVAITCDKGGLREVMPALLGALMPAFHRDEELSRGIATRIIEPILQRQRSVFDRARARGEITTDVDLDHASRIIPGIVLHDALLLGRDIQSEEVESIIDTVVLPCCGAGDPPAD